MSSENELPKGIEAFLSRHPEFRALYEAAYTICRNVERMMEMFSEELRILDRNTVNLMIDELKEEVDSLQEENSRLRAEIASLKNP